MTDLPLDLVTLGRIGVDLYPGQSGVPLERVTDFQRSLGGTAANVAVAGARLGLRSALVSKVGDDAFGRFAVAELERLSVDTRWVGVHPTLRTGLAFCALQPPDDFPLLFYRNPVAPDDTLAVEDFELDAAMSARLLWTTGSALIQDRAFEVARYVLERHVGDLAVHDLDLRPALWDSLERASARNLRLIPMCDVVVGNLAEIELLSSQQDPIAAAESIAALGPSLVIIKCGPEGAVFWREGVAHHQPAIPSEVINGLGAGDAFGGALCWGLLQGLELDQLALLCAGAGSLVTGRLECAAAMPTTAELADYIGNHSVSLDPNMRYFLESVASFAVSR